MKSLYTLLIFIFVSTFAFAQSLFLDSTFNDDGIVETNSINTFKLGDNRNRTYASAIQFDGRILVSGGRWLSDGNLIRYMANGNIDSTFGTNGILFDSSYCFQSIGIQSTNKILLLKRNEISHNFSIDRYNFNGIIDSTFGINGSVTFPWLSSSLTNDRYYIKVQNDDKILFSTDPITANVNNGFYLLRLDSNGAIDSTFGNNGEVSFEVNNSFSYVRNYLIKPDGKILLGGIAHGNGTFNNVTIVQLNIDGTIDSTFGDNGVGMASLPNVNLLSSLALQNDGSIVATSWDYLSDSPPFTIKNILLKFSADGFWDVSFGQNGYATLPVSIDFEKIQNNIITYDDKIIIVGGSTPSLIQYNTDGTRDHTFGMYGKIEINMPLFSIPTNIEIHNNKISVVGSNSINYFIFRLQPLEMLTSTEKKFKKTSQLNTFILYPNPSNNYINLSIELKQNNLITIQITNEVGQTVQLLEQQQQMNKGNFIKTYNIENLPKGKYYLSIISENEIITKPFIKL